MLLVPMTKTEISDPYVGSQKRKHERAISWGVPVDVALGACSAEKASGKDMETPLSLHSLHLDHSYLVIG